jgi:hypothetical protein
MPRPCLLLPFPDHNVTIRVEEPHQRDGLRATIGVLPHLADGSLPSVPSHTERLNLDRTRARMEFAAAAGIDPSLLEIVRERVLEWLTRPDAAEGAMEETLDATAIAIAEALLDRPDLLDEVGSVVAAHGYAGDLALPKVIYLVLLSRLLPRPINLVILGPSSGGKTYAVSRVLLLVPEEAVYQVNGMSDRVLAYTEANLQHVVLIISEASVLQHDGIGASLLRSISWDGKVSYEFVEKTNEGMRVKRIEKEGPTGFITTTTKGVEAELETRTLTLHVSDAWDVTQQILTMSADRAAGVIPPPPDLAPWLAAQRWLATHGDREVIIPFAPKIAPHFPNKQVRARRDFTQLLSLIETHALLCQRQRERDRAGRIIADVRDYRGIYELAASIFGAIAAGGVTATVRATVGAVATLLPTGSDSTLTIQQVADALGVDKSVASRRVATAVKGQWLINDEDRRGKPARIKLGDPLPEESPALPAPELIFGGDTPTITSPNPPHSVAAEPPPPLRASPVQPPVQRSMQQSLQPKNPSLKPEKHSEPANRCTVVSNAEGMETLLLPLTVDEDGRATWSFHPMS